MARVALNTGNLVDYETDARRTYGANLDLTSGDGSVTYTTITTGTNNGVYFSFNDTELIVLLNDSGSSRVFTIPLSEPSGYSKYGITFTDKTYTVANGKTVLIVPDSRLKDSSNYINVDCDGAGKILVVKRYTIV